MVREVDAARLVDLRDAARGTGVVDATVGIGRDIDHVQVAARSAGCERPVVGNLGADPEIVVAVVVDAASRWNRRGLSRRGRELIRVGRHPGIDDFTAPEMFDPLYSLSIVTHSRCRPRAVVRYVSRERVDQTLEPRKQSIDVPGGRRAGRLPEEHMDLTVRTLDTDLPITDRPVQAGLPSPSKPANGVLRRCAPGWGLPGRRTNPSARPSTRSRPRALLAETTCGPAADGLAAAPATAGRVAGASPRSNKQFEPSRVGARNSPLSSRVRAHAPPCAAPTQSKHPPHQPHLAARPPTKPGAPYTGLSRTSSVCGRSNRLFTQAQSEPVTRSCSRWRSSIRRILPVRVLGRLGTNSISRGSCRSGSWADRARTRSGAGRRRPSGDRARTP